MSASFPSFSSFPFPAAVRAGLRRWPSQCAICRGWGAGRVCADCLVRYAAVEPRCRRCAIDVPTGVETCGRCLLRPPPYAAALAAVDYDHPWDALITDFKFGAALDLTGALSNLLADRLVRAGQAGDDRQPDLLLPVPLGDARLRERGYNQAWELARRVARTIGLRADANLLLRVRDTPHQIALPPSRRAANVHGVFAVEPLRAALLRGRRVSLVDDVMTTGATVAEAAAVLLQAGAASVQVWVVARTPLPAPG